MSGREAEEKLRRIFHVAPWLKTDGKAVHIPVSGMDEHHQLMWPELWNLLCRLETNITSSAADGESSTEGK